MRHILSMIVMFLLLAFQSCGDHQPTPKKVGLTSETRRWRGQVRFIEQLGNLLMRIEKGTCRFVFSPQSHISDAIFGHCHQQNETLKFVSWDERTLLSFRVKRVDTALVIDDLNDQSYTLFPLANE